MATAYSSEVSVGTYNRIRIKCDYSGTSATLTVQFRRTSSYTTTWSDTQATLTLGGTEKAAAYNYTGTVGESWVDLRPAISGYTISTSGGTYNWVFNNPGSSSVLGCSGTITIPAQSSAPTGLGANNIVRGVESFTANVYITSWGTGTGTRYRELQCWTYDPSSLVQPRRYNVAYGDALSSDITVDNSSGYTQAYGPLNITGNTKYVLGLYASNGAADTGSQRLGEYTTLAYAPEVTISSISSTSATLAYSTKADGGEYSKTYEYSIDGGTTWTTFATVSSGSAATGTFTVSGLTAATVTVMQTRVTTAAGTTVGPNITLNTNAGPKLYGSVNSQANGVTTLYGGVLTQTITGVTGVIRPGGAGNITAFDGTTFWSAVYSYLDHDKTPSYARLVIALSGSKAGLYVHYAEGGDSNIGSVASISDLSPNTNGITVSFVADGTDYIDLTPVYTPSGSEAAMVNKLYGSVSGQTKLIHQGFGHVDYGYGVITYYTDTNYDTTDTVTIKTQAELNSLSHSGTGDWYVTIDGVVLTSSLIKEISLSKKAATLPDRFMQRCTHLERVGLSASSITTLPNYFLTSCSAFNSPIDLSRITTIGSNFLNYCLNFNQNVTLPSTLTSIGESFMFACNEMTGVVNVGNLDATIASTSNNTFSVSNSTKPAYTTGITIAGANRAAWISRYPDRGTYPCRKLLDAGY